MEKDSSSQVLQENSDVQCPKRGKLNQNSQVAGLQQKHSQSFVDRRGKSSKTMPSMLLTKPKENSKYVQAIYQSLKHQEDQLSKEKDLKQNNIQEEDESNSSSSSSSLERPIMRTTTYFAESDLMMNFDL